MKTYITLLFVVVSTILQAKINPDSLKQRTFRPTLDNYMNQVNFLANAISKTSNVDSVKFFAKKLMRLSDNMEKITNDYYNYQARGGLQVVPLYSIAGNLPTLNYAFIVTPSSSQPFVTEKVNKIYDYAANIRFWSRGNSDKIKKNINKIYLIKEDLDLLSLI